MPQPTVHPGLDERLVQPETREEMLRGELIISMPAAPPHAERHFDLDYVLRAHVAAGYIGASDMLTRVNEGSDFAADASIRRKGIDPATETRYLEELAFELVHTQSLPHMVMRAQDLTERGVRRVLAIFVKRSEVCEWSNEHQRFERLSLEETISDPTLARPLPVRALLDAATADDAVIDALETKGNRRLHAIKTREHKRGEIAGRTRGLEQGQRAGLERAIELICRSLGVELTPERHTHLQSLDVADLEHLLTLLEQDRSWPAS